MVDFRASRDFPKHFMLKFLDWGLPNILQLSFLQISFYRFFHLKWVLTLNVSYHSANIL